MLPPFSKEKCMNKEIQNEILTCYLSSVSYDIDKSMVTFTMVKVLKKQKHFNQALAILNLLEDMDSDKEKIKKEKEEILQSLSEIQP